MPLFSVFSPAAKIGHGIHAPHFHPGDATHAEAWCDGNVEAAVAVQQRRIVAVQLQAFLVSDEHRHLRAVFTGVKDLCGFVVVLIELHGRFAIQLAFAGDHIVAIGCWWRGEAAE